MMIDAIKSLLGDELSAQVEAALKGKGKDGKDLDLVIGNDGSYVPADKYDGEKRGKTSAETALKAAADALKAIGGTGDPARIAEDVRVAQEKLNNLQTNHTAELQKISKNAALRMALYDKVHDPADVIGLLDMNAIELDDQGNLKTDIAPMLKPIQDSKSYLFKSPTKQPDISGAHSADTGKPGQAATKTDGPVVL